MKTTILLLCAFDWAAGMQLQLNPITRVAELLQDLAKKTEADGKMEEGLYNKYKCWCDKVKMSKEFSIADAKTKAQELAANIDDLSNGRVELTSERTDLEEEIKAFQKEIEQATTVREQEKKDFEAAEDEMEKAVAALDGALLSLYNGTNISKSSGLISMRNHVRRVLKVSSAIMSAGDVSALRKSLQIPKPDWEKLNRDATFKKKYEAESGNIQRILKDMNSTFTDNLAEARDKEAKASSDYDSLMTTKKGALKDAQDALTAKAAEKGAREEKLEEYRTEKSDVEDALKRDEKFLTDTTTACDKKAGEWAERQRLRTLEIASINEAISVLRSDDNRDLFKRSFASQSFLQTSAQGHKKKALNSALALLRQTAAATKDMTLGALTASLSLKKNAVFRNDTSSDEPDLAFTEVLDLIGTMLTRLSEEEAADLEKKEYCEKERTNRTNEASMLSKKMDTNTETMERFQGEVDAAKKRVEEIGEEKDALVEQDKEAREQRRKEAAAFAISSKDDADAKAVVEQAIGVLEKFYEDNIIKGFLQKSMRQTPAGEAPAPPPKTWETPYGGNSESSKGVVTLLTMIKDDIQKDLDAATKEENDAKDAHKELLADIDGQITTLNTLKGDLDDEIYNKMEAIRLQDNDRTTNKDLLDSQISFLKGIASGCDFMAVHFDTRTKNRHIETDGLVKAKAILEGAKFD